MAHWHVPVCPLHWPCCSHGRQSEFDDGWNTNDDDHDDDPHDRGGVLGVADRDEVPLALILIRDVGQQVLRLLRLPFKARRRHLV